MLRYNQYSRDTRMSRKSFFVTIVAIVLAGLIISIAAKFLSGREQDRAETRPESVAKRQSSITARPKIRRRQRADISSIDRTGHQKPKFGIFYSDWAGGCSIYGKVTSADSESVYQAQLWLYPLEVRGGYGYGSFKIGAESSDWEGGFAFLNIRSGDYAVVALKEDHVTVYSQIIELESDDDTAMIELKLPQGAAISGKVVDEDEQAVAGAKVSCNTSAKGTVHIWNEKLTRIRTVSGDDGSFEVSGLLEGMEYHISALLTQKTARPRSRAVYGMVNAEAGADDDDVVITLKSFTSGSVAGTVYNTDAKTAVKGARVVLFRKSEEQYYNSGKTTTDDSGAYKLDTNINSGKYKIIAYKEGFFGLGRRLVSLPLELDLEDDDIRFGVDLFLDEGFNISGKVLVKDGGGPAAGVKITAAGIGGVAEDKPRFSITGPNGGFKISSLSEGVYLLKASSKNYTSDIESLQIQAKASGIEGKDEFIKAIYSRYSMWGAGLCVGIVKVGPGASAEGLVFTVMQGRSVNGRVVDGNGNNIGWAQITVSGMSEDGLYFRQETRSRQDGSFQIKALSPFVGKWRINLEHDKYLDTQEELQFAPGENIKQVRLVMSAGLSISGKVTDSGGAPISGAALVIAGSGFEISEYSEVDARTDAEGLYTIVAQTPGTYVIAARKKGFASDTREEVVVEDEDLYGVDFCLETGIAIKGRILFEDGKPLKNFDFTAYLKTGGAKVADLNLRTGHDGSFTLNDLADETFDITFTGSRSWGQPWKNLSFNVTVENVAAGTDDLEIVLEALGTVSGQVVDRKTGQTVDQYYIGIKSLSEGRARGDDSYVDYMGPGMPAGMNMKRLNHEDGMFLLEGIYPGDYILYTRAEGYVINSKRITVPVGEDLSGIEIELLNGFKVSGRLVKQPGPKPVQDAGIKLSGPSFGRSESDAYGRFTMTGIPPGDYDLEAGRYDVGIVERSVSVDGNLDLGDIVINSEGECTLAGKILIKAEGDIEVVRLAAEGKGVWAEIEDGAYRFNNLSPGAYEINLHYHKDNNCAGYITRRTTVRQDVENRLDFVISGGVSVSCLVKLNGTSVSRAELTLIGDGGVKVSPIGSDDAGYSFNNIAPGQYKVVVDKVIPGDVTGSAQMADVDYRREVTVGSEDVELTLDIQTFYVEGVLYGVDGNAAVYRTLVAEPADGGEGEKKFYTDGYGQFSFYGWRDGNYKIYVVNAGSRKQSGDYFFQTGGDYRELTFYEK